MKRLIAVLLLCLIVLPAMGQNKFIPPMKPRGFVTTAVLAESTTVLRALAAALTGDLMLASAFADSARNNGVGLPNGTKGNYVTWEGVDTMGSHTFPVMLFFEFDSSFLSKYGTTGFGGPQYNGPDSLMLDSLRAILPNAADGDTVGYRLVWGMIPWAWTDSIGTTFSIRALNNGTTWSTLGWATNSKVIPPYWSYMVKIVEVDGTPPGRSTLAIRARYRW